MNDKIKLHFQKYMFYDLLAIFLAIFISFFVIKLYNDYEENKKSEYDFSFYNSSLIEAYNIDPSLFKFNEDNVAILEVSDLLKPITNGTDTMYFDSIPLTKEQDQCVGYIVVKKENDSFKFDYSHICDMIDY